MGASVSIRTENSNEIVNNFIDDRIKAVTYQKNVPLINFMEDYSIISDKTSSCYKMNASTKSLKVLALRHHSSQKNSYIPQSTVVFPSSKKGLGSNTNDSFSSKEKGSNNSLKKSSKDSITNIEGTNNGTVSLNTNEGRKRPNLRINIQDDIDWIQVSDGEGGDDDDLGEISPRDIPRQTLNINGLPNQSYLFTQSGTIFIDGFKDGIGKGGIVDNGAELRAVKVPMRDRLLVLCRVGQGASSVVYKALDLIDMRIVALKMISVYERSKRRQMVRELNTLFQMLRQKRYDQHFLMNRNNADQNVMSNINKKINLKENLHEYIVDFYDAFSNVDEGGVALMMEYMDGGSLQDIVDNGGCDDENTLASIAAQALSGLAFLHSCSQLHRDLKPGNFLISLHGEVKVADMGIVRQMSMVNNDNDNNDEDVSNNDNHNQDASIARANTFVGTATYMAPERIDGREYSYPSDIWAFGLSLMTVALGTLPIDTKGGYWSILHSIRDSSPPTLPENSKFSPELRDFLNMCLRHNPDERYSCLQLLEHPFIKKYYVTEPESDILTEDHGITEIRSIMSALYLHIARSKAVILPAGTVDRNKVDKGDYSSSDISNVLRTYLIAPNTRNRLSELAKQLHLSEEKLVDEINTYCDTLINYDKQSFIQTPKASHSSY